MSSVFIGLICIFFARLTAAAYVNNSDMENLYWGDSGSTNYPELNENIAVDTAIIGGGLAGLMCAEELSARGRSVAVIEAEAVGGGNTAGSSAMVSFAHDLIYKRLIGKHGEAVAGEYLRLNKYGLEHVRELAEQFDCDAHDADMYLFATTDNGAELLEAERDAYETLGERVVFEDAPELPFKTVRALKIANQAYLNPLKFARGLAEILTSRGVKLYENTRVISAPKGGKLTARGYTVKADNFVIASHFPYIDFPGCYFLKMYQSRSYNAVFNSNVSLRNIYESAEDDGFEYRPANGGILCGGAGIRTGKSSKELRYNIVENEIKRRFDDAEITAKFSAQDCMTSDMLPFVGRYGGSDGNVFVITGFNKWGFTTSAAAAKIIADEIDGGSAHANIFSPDRFYTLKSPLKSLKNFGEVIAGYAALLSGSGKAKASALKRGEAAVIFSKGKRLGVYRNENGILETVSAVCPHLGCALKWNPDERTWDCPCHGSRFDTQGNIIASPTTKSLENKGDGTC